MLLETIGAPELSAVADEDVVPLAAELAHSMRHMDHEGLVEQVTNLFERFARAPGREKRNALRSLVAASLAVLAALPGTTVLYQAPDRTRPIRISGEDYDSFRFGRLRHVVFPKGMYDDPEEGDVLQLLERKETGLTGRDALVEVLCVTRGTTPRGEPFFIASIRPWRGAGTDSAAQAVLSERHGILSDSVASLRRLAGVVGPKALSQEHERVVSSVAVALEMALGLCSPPLRQAGQISMRISSSPSGHEGNVMFPPGKVTTTHSR
jgi:hypothetical protein